MAASRISVDVTGSSSELQAAVGRASASLKSLGDVLAKQTDMALRMGEQTTRANSLVGKSFQGVAREAKVASDSTIRAFERQGAVALDSGKQQVRSYEQTAAAARESARVQVVALDEASVAALRSANTHVTSAKRIESAYGSAHSSITRAGKGISLSLIAAAAVSADLAIKFQANTLRMETQAGATAKQLDLIRKGLIAMAPQVGQTPMKLADAMYHVVSSMNAVLPAAHRVTAELHIQKIAAEGAVIGHSNLEDTTYALASAMNALHSPVGDAAKVMGQLNAIVGAGDMTMSDLLEALKSGLIPTARTFHVSLQSVGSALAVMGDMGMRGALAGTRLRMSLALLGAPAEKAAKLLEDIGMKSSDAVASTKKMSDLLEKAGLRITTVSDDLRKPNGLATALQDINQHLIRAGLSSQAAAALISDAFGGGRSGAAIQLMAQNVGRLQTKFDQIGHSGGQFSKDWQAASHTTQFELKQIEAGAAALATRLGTDLLPAVNTGIHDFSAFVGWIERGSTAAHALEIAVGSLATVAIGSYLVSNLAKAVKLMREFNQFVNSPLGSAQRLGQATRPGALPGRAGGLVGELTGTGAGMMIGGVRTGGMLPGSPSNPIVTVVEAGDIGGLGARSASGLGTTEQRAAQAEKQAMNGVVPAGAGAGAVEAEAAKGIKATLNNVLGGLMKGGLIAGLGITGSQLAGSAIGGQAGKDVSKIGTFASAGAGLGSFLGPEGTLAGGVAGALVGGLDIFLSKDADKYGHKLADAITKPLGSAVSDATKSAITNSANQAHALAQQATTPSTPPPGGRRSIGGRGPNPAGSMFAHPAATAAAENAALTAEGKASAQAFVQAFSTVQIKTVPAFIMDAELVLDKLPPKARQAAASAMVSYAQSLQQNGQLPKNAADNIIVALENHYMGLTPFLASQGKQSSAVIASTWKWDGAVSNLAQAETQMRTRMGLMATDPTITGKNVIQAFGSEMSQLQVIAAQTTGAAHNKAMASMRQLQTDMNTTFAAMLSNVQTTQQSMAASIAQGSAKSAQAAQANYAKFDQSVQNAMSAGALVTSEGMRLIAQAADATIKAFGGTAIPIPALIHSQQLQQAFGAGQTGVAGVLTGSATGGFIGAPGERGRDEVPIVVGRGEAVLNHQQQSLVNAYVPGGLDAVFSKTAGAKHWMAAGGYVDPIPGFSLGRTDMGVDASAAPGTPIVAIGDSRLAGVIPNWYNGQPLLDFQLQSGPDAGRYWYVAEQISPVTETIGAMFKAGQLVARYASSGTGIEIGWAANASGTTLAQATGQLGTGDHSNAPAGAEFRAFLGGLAQGKIVGGGPGLAAQIAAPGVSGKGAVADMVRAALAQAASAANAYVGARTAGLGAGAGMPVNVPGGLAAWLQQGMALAGVSGGLWLPMLERQAMRESSGNPNSVNRTDINAQQGNPSEGLLQTTLSTFAKYAVSGHGNILNPVDNTAAAIRYMIATYGHGDPATAVQVMWARGGGAYAGGGYVGAATGRKPAKPAKPAKPPKKTPIHEKTLKPIAGVNDIAAVNTILGDINQAQADYSAHATLFNAQSPNGLTQDQIGALIGYDNQQITDQQRLQALIPQLLGEMGVDLGHASGRVTTDTKKLAANKHKIEQDRQQLAILSIPVSKKALEKIRAQLVSTRNYYTAQIAAARRNNAVSGGDLATKASLQDQIAALPSVPPGRAHDSERARVAQRRRALGQALHQIDAKINGERTSLTSIVSGLQQAERGEIGKLDYDRVLEEGRIAGAERKKTLARVGLRRDITRLVYDDSRIQTDLTGAKTAVGQLGGVDVTTLQDTFAAIPDQILTEQADIINLQRTANAPLSGDATATAAAGADNSALLGLLRQQNTQLAETLALNEAQTRVLAGMIPEIPRFEKGGPVLDDGLAYVHRGEHVIPRGGTLVTQGGGGPPHVTLEQHYHGHAGALMSLIDERIQHPDNVRAVSTQIGRRTSMLSNRPGSRRTDRI